MEDSDHQSGALIIGSNDDLLTEILIRLPVTSILRFKSVCKHWRLLLTHTHFTHRYDDNNNNNNNFSKSVGVFDRYGMYYPFDVENRSPPFRSLDFYFNRSHVIIEQSCNGLLLCSTVHNGDLEYYVFNPTTKQLACIPSLPENIHSMVLAFHPTHCVHYKVVCICALEPEWNSFQIQVYSSETRKWKLCIELFYVHTSTVDPPVYCNGAVYWAPSYYESSGSLVCYKLDVEQLQMLPVPEGSAFDEITTMYFGESRGHLHLILYMDNDEDILRLNVHEMLTDYSGWFVKYRLQLDEVVGAFPNMVGQSGYHFQVGDVVRGKEEEETFLVLSSNKKMIRYNVHDKSFKQIHINKTPCRRFHRYIETLSSF